MQSFVAQMNNPTEKSPEKKNRNILAYFLIDLKKYKTFNRLE